HVRRSPHPTPLPYTTLFRSTPWSVTSSWTTARTTAADPCPTCVPRPPSMEAVGARPCRRSGVRFLGCVAPEVTHPALRVALSTTSTEGECHGRPGGRQRGEHRGRKLRGGNPCRRATRKRGRPRTWPHPRGRRRDGGVGRRRPTGLRRGTGHRGGGP